MADEQVNSKSAVPGGVGGVDLSRFGLDPASDDWVGRVRRVEAPAELGRLGDYELQEVVGQGGQGVVYRACQVSTGRIVALKRLLSGRFATDPMRARFAREIEVDLALRHPSIVIVHDLELIDGQPILVMEWIDGLPFDRWACPGGRAVPPGHVLPAFLKVCGAVQHAHQRGVIHRDLKPSNILVDGADEPRVLDFGLAGLVGPAASALPSLTRSHGFVGTLGYAPPEQVRGDPEAPDVRSDVYALGCILYQALTGRAPFGEERDLAALVAAIDRGECARPSSMNRGLDADLDAIVGKAMATEPGRRYQSVEGLSADIQRHLAGEPVEARRGSRWYVVRKALRRHRVSVAVGAAFVLVLSGGLAGSIAQWQRAENERIRAVAQGRRAEFIVGFVTDLFGSANPHDSHGSEFKVRQMLDEFAIELEGRFPFEPRVEAELRRIIGEAYRDLGMLQKAEPHLERALSLAAGFEEESELETARGLVELGALRHDQGQYGEAERLTERAVAIYRARPGKHEPELVDALGQLGDLQHHRDDPATERTAREALAMARRLHGDEHPQVAMCIFNLGASVGDGPRAVALTEEALAMRRRLLGDGHPVVAFTLNGLADRLKEMGDNTEALDLYEQALAMRRRMLGDEHPIVATTLGSMAVALGNLDRPAEAQALLEQALRINRAAFGGEHPNVAGNLHNLASQHLSQGRLEAGADFARQAVDMRRRVLGEDHPDVANSLNTLATILFTMGLPAEAEQAQREALEIDEKLLGPDAGAIARDLHNLAAQLEQQGKAEEALNRYRQAREMCRRLGPTQDNFAASCLERIGLMQLASDPEGAEAAHREALSLREQSDVPATSWTADTLWMLADTLRIRRKLDEAEGCARRSVEIYESLTQIAGFNRAKALQALAAALIERAQRAESIELLARAAAIARQTLPEQHPQLADMLVMQGKALIEEHRFAEAEPALRECLAIRVRRMPDSWRRFNAMSLLGASLSGRAALILPTDPSRATALFAEAEPFLLDGYNGMENDPQSLPIRKREALDRLVTLYDAWHKPDLAAHYRALLDSSSHQSAP